MERHFAGSAVSYQGDRLGRDILLIEVFIVPVATNPYPSCFERINVSEDCIPTCYSTQAEEHLRRDTCIAKAFRRQFDESERGHISGTSCILQKTLPHAVKVRDLVTIEWQLPAEYCI